ncbi:EpsG family protein [Senegalia sp. (in: firmicutes)]|uniref:EpsG family protein n=1 Tax=Senegalia sp. (in: firmicutes) TaxID=1924098 RepID=UPI003F991210
MKIYIIQLIIIIFLIFIRNKITKKQMNIILFIYFIFLAIVAGLRFEIGTDYINYNNIYKYSEILIKDSPKERGFYAINLLFQKLNINFQMSLMIFSIVSNFLMYYGIIKLSKNPAISTFLYLATGMYYSFFNITRQGLAIAFILLAIYLLIKKRFILYYIIITIIALVFHRTAIILFIVPLIMKINIKTKYILLTFITIIVAQYFNLINRLVFYINDILKLPYGMYKEKLLESVGVNPLNMVIPTLLIIIIVIFKNQLIQRNKVNKLFINISYIHYIFTVLSLGFIYYSRIAIYFELYILILVPELNIIIGDWLETIRISSSKYFKFLNGKYGIFLDIVIVLLFFMYIALRLSQGIYGIVPYRYSIDLF